MIPIGTPCYIIVSLNYPELLNRVCVVENYCYGYIKDHIIKIPGMAVDFYTEAETLLPITPPQKDKVERPELELAV